MTDADPDPAATAPRVRRRPGRGRKTAAARPRLAVAVEAGRGSAASAGLARWLAGIAPPRARGEVAIALVGDRRMAALNERYRGVPGPTDVLSFPSDPLPFQARLARGADGRFLGDIVIATGVARRQARRKGHALATELRILALHGLLHLLGYDHERDRGQMARVERRLRRRGGLPAGLVERHTARGGRR